MSIFFRQLANVIQWEEFREDMIFYKWKNDEIKKGSKLIIRPGQDAVFLFNGKCEGIFKDEGSYDIESQIIPFLSTLSGFKFGFNSGMRAEVLFINTKEFTVKWGTKNPINIPAQGLPGGIPIRANGTFNFHVKDYIKLIEKVAGVKDSYFVEDVKLRITSVIDQLLMKWIVKVGKDMFNLQANAFDISTGIKTDLDMQLFDSGISISGFQIMSFTYPDEIQQMINKNASHSMIQDVNKFQQIAMTEGISTGKVKSGGLASDVTGMMMGMQITNQMLNNMNISQTPNQSASPNVQTSNPNGTKPNFCPNCGTKTDQGNFCSNCGQKLI